MKNKKKDFNFGYYQEHVAEVIKELVYDTPKRFRVDIAHDIAFNAANYGGRNIAEGVGILELAKKCYIETSIEVSNQEFEEMKAKRDQENACGDCKECLDELEDESKI